MRVQTSKLTFLTGHQLHLAALKSTPLRIVCNGLFEKAYTNQWVISFNSFLSYVKVW